MIRTTRNPSLHALRPPASYSKLCRLRDSGSCRRLNRDLASAGRVEIVVIGRAHACRPSPEINLAVSGKVGRKVRQVATRVSGRIRDINSALRATYRAGLGTRAQSSRGEAGRGCRYHVSKSEGIDRRSADREEGRRSMRSRKSDSWRSRHPVGARLKYETGWTCVGV